MEMIYFKDPKDNSVWAYEHDVPKTEVKSRLVRITEEEAEAITNPPPTKERLIEQAEDEKQYLMSEATAAISPLNDAVDFGMATPEEDLTLKKWRKYRVLLNRVDTSTAPDIIWPEKP